MGKRGPAPKPSVIKILQGNPGKRPINPGEPKPQRGIPPCPEWLDGEAKAEWARVTPELDRVGLLTIVDRAVLICYCTAVGELERTTGVLRREGHVIRIGGQPAATVEDADGTEAVTAWAGGQMQPHPAVAQRNAAMKQVKDFAALLGLDPSSRTRLHTDGEAEAAPKVQARKRG